MKKRERFLSSIKKIESEEIKLLNLQKKYRNGEIREEDLTKEEIEKLCMLYDKQIAELKKSNEIRKQKLLKNKINIKPTQDNAE